MQYWLVKTEPQVYSWDDLVRDKTAAWTGVRNYGARNNLRAMHQGDHVLYYYSMTDQKSIVGMAEVTRAAYHDPTAQDPAWLCVDIKPVKLLPRPVTLVEIKATPALRAMQLVTHGRLSVQKITPGEFKIIQQLANRKVSH